MKHTAQCAVFAVGGTRFVASAWKVSVSAAAIAASAMLTSSSWAADRTISADYIVAHIIVK